MTKPAPTIAPARFEQITEFLSATSFKGAELYPLAGDASFRRYIRLRTPTGSAMLMDAPPDKEDVRPFIAAAEYLYNHGFSAPFIHARDETLGLLLLEDLGDDSFSSVLKSNPGKEMELYAAAIDILAQWHDRAIGFTKPHQLILPLYDEALLMREVSLLPDWYLPQALGESKAASVRDEYMGIWKDIIAKSGLTQNVWVHRDYHADNLMWLPGRDAHKRVGLLDFQDGVYGDAAYDMVSLLEDARRDVQPSLADAMLKRYIAAANVDRERFLAAYAVLGAQRNCKIVGIFSRLAVRDGKFGYLNFLPRVWRHLENDLKHPILAPLKSWMDKYVPVDQRGVITIRATAQKQMA